jgi:hypothetical protein
VLYSDFEEVSNKYYFSNIVLTFNAGKMANAIALQRIILEIQKSVEVHI